MEEDSLSWDSLQKRATTGRLQEAKISGMRPHNEFRFYRNHEYARQPKKAYESDAGYDLCSCEFYKIEPNQWQLVRTGLQFDIPNGWEIQIRPRSGLAAKKGITVLNSHGTIDCEYTGEIMIIIMNHGEFPFEIGPGDRIAQAVFAPVYPTLVVEINEEPINKTRGSNGFGSTGV